MSEQGRGEELYGDIEELHVERETFLKVRNLLSDERRWTRDFSARDLDERSVHPRDPSAVCWCLQGAVLKASPPPRTVGWYRIQRIASETYKLNPVQVNDRIGHAAVLKLLDLTIEEVNRELKVAGE